MIGGWARNAMVATAIALIAGAAATLPNSSPLPGWSIDALTTLSLRLSGERASSASSPTVVIALDEETQRTPPFKGSPTLTWTPEIGRVVAAVLDGGARVVGFDVVFASSIEESEIPFGEETLGAKARGFDRDFLRALAISARDGKIVLGEAQFGEEQILPTRGQRIAVGGLKNIRGLNVHRDWDRVVRRVPLTFETDGDHVPSFALELASRFLNTSPQYDADGAVSLAGYRIPSAVANTMTLNFADDIEGVPTFSLADLRACLEKGDGEFFRRNFAGKAVLVGSALASADRMLTSKRIAATPASATLERCEPPSIPAMNRAGQAINGVYVQATAINNLIRRDPLSEASQPIRTLIATTGAAAASFAALLLAPAVAVASLLGLAAAWIAVAIVTFRDGLALPLFEPLGSGALALGASVGVRIMVIDREKRFLRKAFALYLAPSIVDKLAASGAPPVLGGETREITVFFSDVVGFSTLSETMKPKDLVELMNEYLSGVADIVEAEGGLVDKFIGDAVVAIFGAPIDVKTHAADAVRAALRCCEFLEAFRCKTEQRLGVPFGHRIGLNTGEALVGNVGSRRRFNYTALGDTVNLAARMETLNSAFGTRIIASQSTRTLAGDNFIWRELDTVRVKGRARPETVYEPLAMAATGADASDELRRAYAAGLAAWRGREFERAAEAFSRFASDDPPAALFLVRAEAMRVDPPGGGWEPVFSQTLLSQ
jgi:class 3 adenylate cyclase